MNEDLRQSIHFAFGILLAGILVFFGRHVLLAFTLLSLLTAISLSIAARKQAMPKEIQTTLSTAQRLHEKEIPFVAGMIFLLGVLMLAVFFENQTAVLAGLLVLSVGDSASTIFGKKFGKTKLNSKHTLEGTLAGITASFLALLAFLSPAQAFLGASFGMLSELLQLEDNVTIPIASAAILALIL